MDNKKIISLGLLLFIPISAVAKGFTHGLHHITIAIIPLAVWLSTATEEIVCDWSLIGGLLNAVFGNATELIIAF